jgi:hypothetical protein
MTKSQIVEKIDAALIRCRQTRDLFEHADTPVERDMNQVAEGKIFALEAAKRALSGNCELLDILAQ